MERVPHNFVNLNNVLKYRLLCYLTPKKISTEKRCHKNVQVFSKGMYCDIMAGIIMGTVFRDAY
jgi:hypothetical protein